MEEFDVVNRRFIQPSSAAEVAQLIADPNAPHEVAVPIHTNPVPATMVSHDDDFFHHVNAAVADSEWRSSGLCCFDLSERPAAQ
ncbi:MAG: hypothetical protein JO117_09250, partial [Verrucomicrobia bacterium]|nr:hypothetical protein [Verrucomicrobiota bacterium]